MISLALEGALQQQISAEKGLLFARFVCAQIVLEWRGHRAASPLINETGCEERGGPGNLRWRKNICFAGGSASNDVCSAVQAGPCNVNTNIEVSPFWGVQAGLGIALQFQASKGWLLA